MDEIQVSIAKLLSCRVCVQAEDGRLGCDLFCNFQYELRMIRYECYFCRVILIESHM